jgi:hypothetical protein
MGGLIWVVIVCVVAVLLLAWQYIGFRLANRTLPAGATAARLPIEGLTREQALNVLEVAFATPIEISYYGERLTLPPDSVALRYDAETTAANLEAALNAQQALDDFIVYLLRRSPEPLVVPVAVSYSPERLGSFLARVADQYDRAPLAPTPLPEGLTFYAGRPGYTLDVSASRQRLSEALVSAVRGDQLVELVVQVEPPPPPQIDALRQLIQSLLDAHSGLIPGIFIKDLQSGEEVAINADVAYTGMDVLKIAILVETYRALDPPLAVEQSDWISDVMGSAGSNVEANILLRDVIGGGDGYQGVETLTHSMIYLGLFNTFMAAPYDEENTALTVVTPANSRSDVDANPDPAIQTTPLDIGLLLEMIYQCSRGGGALLAAYPEDLTPDECRQMIAWMERNQMDNLIEAGVPVGTPVAHKHGFTGDTHADAAIVFSPGGDFILVAYLYRFQWLEWEESAPLIVDIAAATYSYFNPTPDFQ